MTYTGATLGLSTNLGYLYCATCARELGLTGEPVAYAPHADEPCERCGRILNTSVGHVGYSWTIEAGIVEVVRVGESIIRAPLSHPFDVNGRRNGREWWPAAAPYEAMWRDITWSTIDEARADMMKAWETR